MSKEKKTDAVRAVRRLGRYPHKVGINLNMHEKRTGTVLTLVIGCAAIVLLAGLVAKFGVIDQYRRLSQAEEAYVQVHRQYEAVQEELADYLKKEGYQVTQATISRDIRELKLTKIATNDGRQKYALMQPQGAGMNEKYLRVLKDGFVSMDMAQNILVIKTVSGMAMAVAAAIDAMHWSEVAGCIAGDDTIMCAIRSAEDTLRVMDKIGRIAGRQ